MTTDLPAETAYYYPEPYWLVDESSWIKNLLLFFDGVAILLPEYMRGRHIDADPTLAAPHRLIDPKALAGAFDTGEPCPHCPGDDDPGHLDVAVDDDLLTS